jgi:hypothetical protein
LTSQICIPDIIEQPSKNIPAYQSEMLGEGIKCVHTQSSRLPGGLRTSPYRSGLAEQIASYWLIRRWGQIFSETFLCCTVAIDMIGFEICETPLSIRSFNELESRPRCSSALAPLSLSQGNLGKAGGIANTTHECIWTSASSNSLWRYIISRIIKDPTPSPLSPSREAYDWRRLPHLCPRPCSLEISSTILRCRGSRAAERL